MFSSSLEWIVSRSDVQGSVLHVHPSTDPGVSRAAGTTTEAAAMSFLVAHRDLFGMADPTTELAPVPRPGTSLRGVPRPGELPGMFIAAMSHCASQDTSCVYDTSASANYACYASGWCSEAIYCGTACNRLGACPGGVWTGLTHITPSESNGCGSTVAPAAGGVLCCKSQ